MKRLVLAAVAALVVFLSERAYGDSEQNQFAVVNTIQTNRATVKVTNFDIVTDSNGNAFRIADTIYGYHASDSGYIPFTVTLVDLDQRSNGLLISHEQAGYILQVFGVDGGAVTSQDQSAAQVTELIYMKERYEIRYRWGGHVVALVANDPIPEVVIMAGMVFFGLLDETSGMCDYGISLQEVIDSRGAGGRYVDCQ